MWFQEGEEGKEKGYTEGVAIKTENQIWKLKAQYWQNSPYKIAGPIIWQNK